MFPKNTPELKPIPAKEELEQRLKNNPDIARLVKEGDKLLETLNQPNVITLEQFSPYVSLFTIDYEKYEQDRDYRLFIARLCQQFRVNLSINLHVPTLVIRSKEDRTVEYHLDRVFTRIKPDALEDGKKSARAQLGPLSPTAPQERREDMIVGAMISDVATANQTPEQMAEFRRMRTESALITKRFVDHNLSAAKREELLGNVTEPDTLSSANEGPSIVFDDDD